jgi:hypothetical protein
MSATPISPHSVDVFLDAIRLVQAVLHELDESPWASLRGKAVDSRWLSRQLSKYDVRSKNIRTEDKVIKGYDAADLADPWSRYLAATSPTSEGLPPPPQGSATAATSATAQPATVLPYDLETS